MVKETVKLFVEGGGDRAFLKSECKRGFNAFLEKAGFKGHMPRIVASGSRISAYDDYCTAIKNGENALLLVDSEGSVKTPTGDIHTWNPWEHLKSRDGDRWVKPDGAFNVDCHLMVQMMEAWFLADIAALKLYYGTGFNENALPRNINIEAIPKAKIEDALKSASKATKKETYDKGRDSFDVLSGIDPAKVIDKSPWAKRFILLLSEKCAVSLK